MNEQQMKDALNAYADLCAALNAKCDRFEAIAATMPASALNKRIDINDVDTCEPNSHYDVLVRLKFDAKVCKVVRENINRHRPGREIVVHHVVQRADLIVKMFWLI